MIGVIQQLALLQQILPSGFQLSSRGRGGFLRRRQLRTKVDDLSRLTIELGREARTPLLRGRDGRLKGGAAAAHPTLGDEIPDDRTDQHRRECENILHQRAPSLACQTPLTESEPALYRSRPAGANPLARKCAYRVACCTSMMSRTFERRPGE